MIRHFSILFYLSLLATNSCIGRKGFVHAFGIVDPTIVAVPLTSTTKMNERPSPKWTSYSKDAPNPLKSSLFTSNELWSNSAYQSSLRLHSILTNCTDSYISPLLHSALRNLANAYRLYGPENVIASFNGGKDAVVILELLRAAHARYYADFLLDNTDEKVVMIKPRVIYFDSVNEFPQVLSFVQKSVNDYDLNMLAFEDGVGFKMGLQMLVDSSYPTHLGFVLGTRASDPNAKDQGIFAPSSSYMPRFMREWSYGHVWHFLRLHKLPYCKLYDQGYTSLGSVLDTLPCPALRKVDAVGSNGEDTYEEEYYPAYMLKDWDQERAGRINKDKKIKTAPTNISQVSTFSENTKTNGHMTNKLENFSKVSIGNDLDGNTDIPGTVQVSFDPIIFPKHTAPKENNVECDEHDSVSSSSKKFQRTVGLIVIGDEILKGLTPDINAHAAAVALRSHNVPLSRVVFTSDDQSEIVTETKRMQQEVDVIITSGGVGPTHDDVTIKSVSIALDSEMILNEDMAKLLRRKMNKNTEKGGTSLKQSLTKMATLPSCSKLRYFSSNDDDWPVLQCKNVFILPGVPQFFKPKVELVASYLSTHFQRSSIFKVILSTEETQIVDILNSVVKNHPDVSFGSYPFVDHPEFKTVVTVEGRVLAGGRSMNSGVFLVPPYSTLLNDESLSSSEDSKEGITNKDEGDVVTFLKEQIDLHVKLALSDLVNRLPGGSVLRVENNDNLNFA